VLPAVLAAALDKSVVETLTHVKHAARHDLKFSVPFLDEGGILKDGIDQASTMDRGVGPEGSCDLLQTRHHNFGLSFAASNN